MKKSKLETARSLANAHSEVEPSLKRVCLLIPINEQDPNDPIKLLEVVEGTIERGIEPVAFTPDPAHDVEYPSMVIEVSPSEFESLKDRKIRLGNQDWAIGEELVSR